jgi:hypothetical protein
MKEKAQKYNIGTGYQGWSQVYYAGCPEWKNPLLVSGLDSSSDTSPIDPRWASASDKNKIHRYQQFKKVLNILDDIYEGKTPSTSELSVRGWVMLVKIASKQVEILKAKIQEEILKAKIQEEILKAKIQEEILKAKIFKAIAPGLKEFKENLNGQDDSNLNFQAGFNKIDIFNAHLVNNIVVPYKDIMKYAEEKIEQIELKIEERIEQIETKKLEEKINNNDTNIQTTKQYKEEDLVEGIVTYTAYKSSEKSKLNPIIEAINYIYAIKENNDQVPLLEQDMVGNIIHADIFNFALNSNFCPENVKDLGLALVWGQQNLGYKIVGTSKSVKELEESIQKFVSKLNNSATVENTNQVDLKIEEKIETKKTTEPTKIETVEEARYFIISHKDYDKLPENVRKMGYTENGATYKEIALAVLELDQDLVGVVEFPNFDLPN